MGSSQSVLTPEAAVALVVAAGAIGIGYTQLGQTTPEAPIATQAPSSSGKKGKKKQNEEKTQPAIDKPPPAPAIPPVPVAKIVPGGFEPDKISSAPAEEEDAASSPPSKVPKEKNKKKKKKTKAAPSATAPASSSRVGVVSGPTYDSESSVSLKKTPPTQPSRKLQPSASIDTDGSWTRVESGRRKRGAAVGPAVDLTTTTDPGIFTGNSSPITERTEDSALDASHPSVDDPSLDDDIPLAERLLPKPVKTAVDDMLETPDYPTLARVMRIQPRPDEKPASGFSWADYEDVQATESTGGGNDADGEDEGWGVVRRKRSRPDRTPLSSSQLPEIQPQGQKSDETLTKRQRQNARKREEQKAGKAEAEAERLAALAKHKKALEKERMAEQFKKPGSGKAPSGGMMATVDDRGKLVWE